MPQNIKLNMIHRGGAEVDEQRPVTAGTTVLLHRSKYTKIEYMESLMFSRYTEVQSILDVFNVSCLFAESVSLGTDIVNR